MDCPRCGTPMEDGVCPSCGFPVNCIRCALQNLSRKNYTKAPDIYIAADKR